MNLNKYLNQFIIFGCLTGFSTLASAASYQIFPNLAYDNPATLNRIEKGEITVGEQISSIRLTFDGSVGAASGVTTSNETDYEPYGRFAWRLAPQVVIGFYVTNPIFSDFQYPSNSFARYSSIDTLLYDKDYSPKISYQINERLAVGFGADINNLSDAEISFAIPPYGELMNKGSSWGYGWDAGLSYAVTQMTFVNLAYYSKITHHITGNSNWGPLSTDNLASNFIIPATTILNLVQILSQQWLVSATVRYSEFDALRYINLQNTAAGLITLPSHYTNYWSEQLATRYQINQKWAVKAAVEYDGNPQPLAFRPIGLPADSLVIGGVGAEYAITKQLSAQLIYAYLYSRPQIDTVQPAGLVIGRARMNGNLFDASLTWKF